MAFDICLSVGHIIETVLKINSILNNPGASLFIALFPCHCNCTYKILVVLTEIISKLFVLQFVYGLTLHCSPLWEFLLTLFTSRVNNRIRALLASNACLFILYAYIWFHGIHGFCTIRMINIECMWVMMLSYKFNIGCALCNFKGTETYFELKKFKFYFFSFLMQWHSSYGYFKCFVKI